MGDYLNSFHEGELIWYLSAMERREIDSKTVHRRTPLVQHTLLRNEVYVAYRPELFKPEYPIKYIGKEIIADSIMRKNDAYIFLGVDSTQSMAATSGRLPLTVICAARTFGRKNMVRSPRYCSSRPVSTGGRNCALPFGYEGGSTDVERP